jgi:aspartyl-tRNA(Asn)/glutamyl-tRNA(Gln) amidotransferase subunit C
MIDVNKVAHLARLAINETEAQTYQAQLTAIFKYFEELAGVDTSNVAPLVTPTDVALEFREDQVKQPISVEEALQNAPEKSGNLFRVPPVV